MKNAGDFVTDFHLSFEPMQALGWKVDTVDWRSEQRWNAFEAVYVCAPWDYPLHAEEFIGVLESIEASSAHLINDLATVKWNLDKTYLRDIALSGHDIVPSIWPHRFDTSDIDAWFTDFATDRLVIKPTVGGNALDTYVLKRPLSDELLDTLSTVFADRAFLVQPFIENIQQEGEYSLFFFDGIYSHAILKTPQRGDFRVQEEHGASIIPTVPPKDLQRIARRVFADLQPTPVYGRGDWVRGANGRYLLMELELIEPSLYLRTNSLAAGRFAHAFDQRFEILSGE